MQKPEAPNSRTYSGTPHSEACYKAGRIRGSQDTCVIFRILLNDCLKPLFCQLVYSINVTVDFTQYN